MIKKLFKLFVILIFISFPYIVFADEVEHNHILSIEEFNINDSEITISGYSFVSHMDNYGSVADNKLLENEKFSPNLKTYLVIYTGDWKDEYVNYVNCDNNSNCYIKQATSLPRDMFYSRCTDEGCKSLDEIKNDRNDNGLSTDGTCQKENDSDRKKWNECLYYNVGFKVTVNFEDSKLKNMNSNVRMKIVSKINDNEKIVNSGFNIHKKICKVNGIECSSKVSTGNYEYQLSDFATSVNYDADWSLAFGGDGNSLATTYFKNEQKYYVLDFKPNQEITKKVNGNTVGTYYDSLIQLDTEIIRCNEDDSSTCYFSNYGNIVVPKSDENTTNEDVDYWTRYSHIYIGGELIINKIDLKVTKLQCNNINYFDTEAIEKIDVDCEDNGTLNQCKRIDEVFSNDYIYVKSKNQSSDCPNDRVKIKINGQENYYTRVKVSTALLFNQVGNFTFGNITPEVVSAGKGFTLQNTSYNNEIIWMIGNVNASGKPAYQYSTGIETLSGGSCISDNFNINDYDKYYYKSDDNYISVDDLKEISFIVMERKANDYIKSSNINNIKFKSYDSNDSSKKNKIFVSGEWTLKNKSNTDFKDFSINDVDVNINKNEIFGKKIINEYSYSLANSAVVVNGEDAAKAKYAEAAKKAIEDNKAVNVGRKYFIDFKWNSIQKWPFNLAEDINPSFIEEMQWNLNGICGIEVRDGYYVWDEGDDESKKINLAYNYRPISLETPFPRANGNFNKIAINWRNWYKNSLNSGDRNHGRLKNTYDKDANYEIILSKFDTSHAVKISEINNLNIGYYNELIGYSLDGTGDFILKNKFETKKIQRSYCRLGFFSTDCDEY